MMENMMLHGGGHNPMLLAAQYQNLNEQEIIFNKKLNRISRKPEKSAKENMREERCILAIGNYRLIAKRA